MAAGLDLKDTLRLIGTHPTLVPIKGGGFTGLFQVSANLNEPARGLGYTLTNVFFEEQEGALDERLAEAVAVGAMRAAASNRARALVLVRSTDTPSAPSDSFTPSDMRAFLSALRVPFFYWTVGPTQESTAVDPWGEAKAIRGWGGVLLAVNALMEALRPQFLVWIEGQHKPGDVTFAADAPPGLRVAGASTP
jgi:hypothetical protein